MIYIIFHVASWQIFFSFFILFFITEYSFLIIYKAAGFVLQDI